MTTPKTSEERFNELWKQYESTFNEDGNFNNDIDVYKGVAKDFFDEQEDYYKKRYENMKAALEKIAAYKSGGILRSPMELERNDIIHIARQALKEKEK